MISKWRGSATHGRVHDTVHALLDCLARLHGHGDVGRGQGVHRHDADGHRDRGRRSSAPTTPPPGRTKPLPCLLTHEPTPLESLRNHRLMAPASRRRPPGTIVVPAHLWVGLNPVHLVGGRRPGRAEITYPSSPSAVPSKLRVYRSSTHAALGRKRVAYEDPGLVLPGPERVLLEPAPHGGRGVRPRPMCPAAGWERIRRQGRVRIRGPSSVMAMVCSMWAARLPSMVRRVHPSGSVW